MHVPGSTQPDLSVVYVTFGTGPIVVRSIATLVASLGDSEVSYEVIVVDNHHPRRMNRAINHLVLDTSGVTVIRPGVNTGFGGGCNLGVGSAHAPIVAIVNPDIEFRPGWLHPLREELDAGAAIAAPVLHNEDGSIQSAGHRLLGDGFTEPITDVTDAAGADYASAACWLMRRAVFDQLGGFDEDFHPAYFEDVDLALAARPLGGTHVSTNSSVVHRHGASTADDAIPDTTPQRLRLLEKWPELVRGQI